MGKRKISLWQHFLYILEFIIVVPLASFISVLPWRLARGFAHGFAALFYKLDKANKKIASTNLDIIFKDKPLSQEEKDLIIKKLYRNIAEFGIEYLKLGSVNKRNYEKFVQFENFENIERVLALGKGVIVVTAHIGNWEFLGSVPAKLGIDLGVIINRQFNPYTDWWLTRIREKKGKIKCFYNEIGDIARIVKHIRQGGVMGILVDQTYYFKPIFVPFFGIQSATADGPAKFHLKYKAPLMMAYCVKQEDGRYLLSFEEHVSFEPTQDFDADCARIMTWINQKYEVAIRKYPDQWFSLLHPRWERTKSEDFADVEWNPY